MSETKSGWGLRRVNQRMQPTASMVSRYQKRISGPLLARVDIHVDVPWVEYDKLADARLGERSEDRNYGYS